MIVKEGKSRSDDTKYRCGYIRELEMAILGCRKCFKAPLIKKPTGFMKECKYGTKKVFISFLLPTKNFSP